MYIILVGAEEEDEASQRYVKLVLSVIVNQDMRKFRFPSLIIWSRLIFTFIARQRKTDLIITARSAWK